MIYSKWNSLSLGTRVQIATAFGIAKTRPTHVVNNTVQDDGFNFMEIERAITVEKMQEVLNSKEKDFDTLWTALVDKTEGRTIIPDVSEHKDVISSLAHDLQDGKIANAKELINEAGKRIKDKVSKKKTTKRAK